MQLTLWTYEGPPHVGAMRVATGLTDVHYVLHAPQGDTYADLLFTMIERRGQRPPVTYTTFQARDLGGDTAELFKTAVRDAHERFKPGALLVGSSCTAELIQDDPGGLAAAHDRMAHRVVPAERQRDGAGTDRCFNRSGNDRVVRSGLGQQQVAPVGQFEVDPDFLAVLAGQIAAIRP